MCTDTAAHDSAHGLLNTEDAWRNAHGDVEDTPRSEVPPSFNVMTPSASEAAAKLDAAGTTTATPTTAGDYFTPQSASSTPATLEHQPPRVRTSNRSPAGSVGASDGHAPGGIEPLADPLASLHPSLRPTPQQTISSLSIESTDSTATIRAPGDAIRPPHPAFPNQAFAALHHQQYPRPYLPSTQRTGGPPPYNSVHSFTSAIASQHASGVRTANNSPAATPGAAGLFNSAGPPSAPALESGSATYPSPFLHYTHTHVPKETHRADVDVDPISGRKMINHYEIIDELGRGTHGKVKLGRDLHSEGTYVAIKIVERFSKRRKLGRLGTTEDKVKKEVAILKKARHPNVVALLEVIDDPAKKKVYIVLEWVERGEIHWRVKGPKEIAMVEARRYEREKSGKQDDRLAAQDRAVLDEAKKRLEKQKRHIQRTFRRMRIGTTNDPSAWSIEMAGDDNQSEESEEDRLSRISSIAGSEPAAVNQQWLDANLGRRPSHTPSPLPPALDRTLASPSRFLRLTSEPETTSPSSDPLMPSREMESSAHSLTGLEGTMYGAYDPVYGVQARMSSLPNSLRGSQHGSSEGLPALAHELLDSYLDPELEYVPVMTMEQCRVAFRDTVLGLQYLHYQGIVHRDIKPPNLLATMEQRVKISDFGVSYLGRPIHDGEAGEDVSEAEAQDLDDEAKELAKTVGTPAFYAPELCITEQNDDPLPVTKAIDVWALGVTLFCMLFARTPFCDTEFVVMRQIADEEVYIPRQRLQPVESKPKSRPSSHGRAFPPAASGKRDEIDFAYEDLGDELYDLLKRLLVKDPRERITLEEVRHHPWVLADLQNKAKWLEETDPTRQAAGKKIEVSKEELNTAVVPLNMVERIKSIVKTTGEKLGFTTRQRGNSSASSTKDRSPGPSAHSSSSTISQDARRQSLRGDDLVSALRASHGESNVKPHGDHPLSKSMAASPESEKHNTFDMIPRLNGSSNGSNRLRRTPSRPDPPHRANTVASAAGSMRTVTQSTYRGALQEESPPPSPGLPSTPMALASPGGSSLGGLLGGTARSIIKSVSIRSRSRQRSRQGRGPISEAGSIDSGDQRAEASLALSQMTAAGHVHQPDSLRSDYTPNSSVQNSPTSSKPQSVTSEQQHLQPIPQDIGLLSRMSSSSSIASAGRRERYRDIGGTSPRAVATLESTAEEWQRADEERVRKLVREHKDETERRQQASPRWSGSSPGSFDGRMCPTSPDDHATSRQNSQVPSLGELSSLDPSEAPSPTTQGGHLPPAMMSSSSDLGSAVSMSISNPSIPSVISEASSVDVYDDLYHDKQDLSSDDTLNQPSRARFDSDDQLSGYNPDQEAAINSDPDDDFDSSSDSDGGLVMSRRKSAARQGGGGGGVGHGTTAPLGVIPAISTDRKERRGTGLSIRSKKSSRSGSNNTMKKVRTRDSADERRTSGEMDISEE